MLLRRQVSTGQLLRTGLLIGELDQAALHMAGKADIDDLYPLQWCWDSTTPVHHDLAPRKE